MISTCSPGRPETGCVDQAGFESRDPAPPSPLLPLLLLSLPPSLPLFLLLLVLLLLLLNSVSCWEFLVCSILDMIETSLIFNFLIHVLLIQSLAVECDR